MYLNVGFRISGHPPHLELWFDSFFPWIDFEPLQHLIKKNIYFYDTTCGHYGLAEIMTHNLSQLTIFFLFQVKAYRVNTKDWFPGGVDRFMPFHKDGCVGDSPKEIKLVNQLCTTTTYSITASWRANILVSVLGSALQSTKCLWIYQPNMVALNWLPAVDLIQKTNASWSDCPGGNCCFNINTVAAS